MIETASPHRNRAANTGKPGESIAAIIPMYNAEDGIERCIRSIQDQTFPCSEIIVVDDCSTDRSVEIVRRLAADDGRIVLLQANVNGGPGLARNLAIAHATSNWISILDSDDTWKPTRNEVLLDLAVRHDADFAFDNISLYDGGAGTEVRPVFERTFREKPVDESEFWKNTIVGDGFLYQTLQYFARAEFFRKNGIAYLPMRYGEDLMFYAKAFRAGARAVLTSEPLYLYTMKQGELSGEKNKASFSVPRFDAVADALQAFVDGHGADMPARVRNAVRKTIRSYHATYRLDLARLAKSRGDYITMIKLLASPGVAGLWMKMRKRARSAKDFSFEPKW